jgi:branched-chain amino acid transport system substrate-binding protein
MAHDLYLLQVKAPGQIKENWDYYTVKETVPGDEAFQPLSETRCRLVTR